MRARDRLGRFVDPGDPAAVPPVHPDPLPPDQAVRLARDLLAEGRAFAAHEVFESSWKAADAGERDLWQGLAQVCVGLTHLQRGNPVGSVTLLRRGAERLAGAADVHGLHPARTAKDATDLAARVAAGANEGWLDV